MCAQRAQKKIRNSNNTRQISPLGHRCKDFEFFLELKMADGVSKVENEARIN